MRSHRAIEELIYKMHLRAQSVALGIVSLLACGLLVTGCTGDGSTIGTPASTTMPSATPTTTPIQVHPATDDAIHGVAVGGMTVINNPKAPGLVYHCSPDVHVAVGYQEKTATHESITIKFIEHSLDVPGMRYTANPLGQTDVVVTFTGGDTSLPLSLIVVPLNYTLNKDGTAKLVPENQRVVNLTPDTVKAGAKLQTTEFTAGYISEVVICFSH